MRGYRFLISASYPYPYHIRSDVVNCYPSVSVLLTMSPTK